MNPQLHTIDVLVWEWTANDEAPAPRSSHVVSYPDSIPSCAIPESAATRGASARFRTDCVYLINLSAVRLVVTPTLLLLYGSSGDGALALALTHLPRGALQLLRKAGRDRDRASERPANAPEGAGPSAGPGLISCFRTDFVPTPWAGFGDDGEPRSVKGVFRIADVPPTKCLPASLLLEHHPLQSVKNARRIPGDTEPRIGALSVFVRTTAAGAGARFEHHRLGFEIPLPPGSVPERPSPRTAAAKPPSAGAGTQNGIKTSPGRSGAAASVGSGSGTSTTSGSDAAASTTSVPSSSGTGGSTSTGTTTSSATSNMSLASKNGRSHATTPAVTPIEEVIPVREQEPTVDDLVVPIGLFPIRAAIAGPHIPPAQSPVPARRASSGSPIAAPLSPATGSTRSSTGSDDITLPSAPSTVTPAAAALAAGHAASPLLGARATRAVWFADGKAWCSSLGWGITFDDEHLPFGFPHPYARPSPRASASPGSHRRGSLADILHEGGAPPLPFAKPPTAYSDDEHMSYEDTESYADSGGKSYSYIMSSAASAREREDPRARIHLVPNIGWAGPTPPIPSDPVNPFAGPVYGGGHGHQLALPPILESPRHQQTPTFYPPGSPGHARPNPYAMQMRAPIIPAQTDFAYHARSSASNPYRAKSPEKVEGEHRICFCP